MAKSNNRNLTREEQLRPNLVKNSFMLHLFGAKEFEELRDNLHNADENLDEEGHTSYYQILKELKWFRECNHISEETLSKYDENIIRHMSHINSNRDVPVIPKYYQWLAAIFTEAYLDLYFQDRENLSNLIEEFLDNYFKSENFKGLDIDDLMAKFMPTLDELRKCSYWMATGSGKTYMIHLAYLQFKYYNKGKNKIDINRTILITPNSDLSAQHLREFRKSGITAEEFNSDGINAYFKTEDSDIINVIEITRFKENKSDSGKRIVDIEYFEKNNLVFTDEAHKGSGGNVWKNHRNELSKEGFTFEYSATFGQASAKNVDKKNENLISFAKSIIFDYSYPHFYNDDYGKEYRVLNVSKDSFDTYRVLVANLLTYYEQKIAYNNNQEIAEQYNIEDPLWIFVGSTVKVEETETCKSDVLEISKFLNKYLTDRNWSINVIDDFISGKSGLLNYQNRHDLFDPAYPGQRLNYLCKQGMNAEKIYDNTLNEIFHCKQPSGLTMVNIKNSEGEIGLRCGNNEFFGDIYVGDSTKFIKEVKKKEPSIYHDEINHDSLFKSISDVNSKVNILIGAKKFIEGWDCYRVSNMGLLHIGKNEGTQIIQLFGRGVRLRGKNNSLKRSTRNNVEQSSELPLLETLNIFGVGADYIGNLKEFLDAEGCGPGKIEKTIDININEDYLNEGLVVPKWEKGGFSREEKFVLTKEDIVPVDINLLVKAKVVDSELYNNIEADTEPNPIQLNNVYLDYVDWNYVYSELLKHKSIKNWNNMIFSQNLLCEIIKDPELYCLYCPENIIKPNKFDEIAHLQEVIISILKKSLQASYSRKRNIWINNNSILQKLDKEDGNFSFGKYVIKVNEDEPEMINKIEKISENIENFIKTENGKYLTNVFFENHLFQPLLAKEYKSSDKIKISPDGLNEGEEAFVKHLWSFVKDKNNAEFLKENKLFLLRNLPKRGIGFYKFTWFYPDFILWIKNDKNNRQRVIFVDPKGLTRINRGFKDEKIQLGKDIKELEKSLNKRSDINIILDSYIVSVSSRAEIESVFEPSSIYDYDKNNVLFKNDNKYIHKILLNNQ